MFFDSFHQGKELAQMIFVLHCNGQANYLYFFNYITL